MSEAEAFSSLVLDIYDAALDPAQWQATLHRAAGFVGGTAASIYAKDATRRDVQFYHDDGSLDREWVRRYAETYVRIDPSTNRHFFLNVEECASTVDAMPYGEFQDTRFSAEWARPQHLVDSVTALLDKSGTRLGLFTVFRDASDGMIDDQTRRRMQSIVPHVRRAALVAGINGASTAKGATLGDTIDALEAAVFVVDASGLIIHANLAGRAMLAVGNPLGSRAGHLTAAEADASHWLSAAVKSAAERGAALETQRVVVPLSGPDGTLYAAHMLPLPSGSGQRDNHGSAVAAIFVRPATLGRVSAPEALAKAYRLTATELRVLLALVEIGGGPEVADALGISATTVKFHLQRLFEKTGVHRQADLVKLVAGFTSP